MRKWQFTPISLPEKSHGPRNLAGYGLQDHKESDTTDMSMSMMSSLAVNTENVTLLFLIISHI